MSRNAGPESSTTGSLQGRDAAAAGGGVEMGGSGLGTGDGLEEVDAEAAGDELVLLATELVPHAAVRQATATRTLIALPMPWERRIPARGYRARNKKAVPLPSYRKGNGGVRG